MAMSFMLKWGSGRKNDSDDDDDGWSDDDEKQKKTTKKKSGKKTVVVPVALPSLPTVEPGQMMLRPESGRVPIIIDEPIVARDVSFQAAVVKNEDSEPAN